MNPKMCDEQIESLIDYWHNEPALYDVTCWQYANADDLLSSNDVTTTVAAAAAAPNIRNSESDIFN